MLVIKNVLIMCGKILISIFAVMEYLKLQIVDDTDLSFIQSIWLLFSWLYLILDYASSTNQVTYQRIITSEYTWPMNLFWLLLILFLGLTASYRLCWPILRIFHKNPEFNPNEWIFIQILVYGCISLPFVYSTFVELHFFECCRIIWLQLIN